MTFGERLAGRVAERRSQVVLGLDLDPARLWPAAVAAAGEGPVAERAAAAVLAHCRAVVDAAAPACVAVKLQLACFERLGGAGWSALARVAAHAHSAGLLVIADGKRGDVPITAAAYAQALVGATPTPYGEIGGLAADALTANPLLGRDSLEPLIAGARAAGAGVFALVRTSNPGAEDVQDLPVCVPPGAPRPLWEALAELVARLGGDGPGLSDVGAVVGATAPDHLERARALMPRTVLLLPGVGAQGGRVQDLGPAFAPGRAGGLVAASRSIVEAHAERGGEPGEAALAAAQELREQAWALSGAGG